jgi:type I restriction enzyme M protein
LLAQYTQAIADGGNSKFRLLSNYPKDKPMCLTFNHDFFPNADREAKRTTHFRATLKPGSFAAYWNSITNDIKSVIASGWNAELIPDDEILQSQFPEVLKELKDNEARRDELQAKFDEVNELEDDVWNEDDYEVWRSKELKEHKDSI